LAFTKLNIKNTLSGVLFVALFSTAAIQISQIPILKSLAISPLIIGILFGMVYANTLRNHLPKEWVPGIVFSAKNILRLAIIFYGFRITFHQIAEVGMSGLLASTIMLSSTFLIGSILGLKVFKLDKETTFLVSAGSSICGAAAVLATEPVVKGKPYQSATAVGTVVVFGTIAMFLYPLIYKLGILNFTDANYGIYAGATIHEVAQVVGAGSAVSPIAAHNAVIVKMTRVILLAPFLILLSLYMKKSDKSGAKGSITIPWFAVLFLVMAGVNSYIEQFEALKPIISGINGIDTFLLTMAMSALGMESGIEKFKKAGIKPLLLALILAVWLMVGGYFIVSAVS